MMDQECHRILNFLAHMPAGGNSTVTKEQLRAILLYTGGWMMTRGYGYDICSKHLGADIYKIYLEPKK